MVFYYEGALCFRTTLRVRTHMSYGWRSPKWVNSLGSLLRSLRSLQVPSSAPKNDKFLLKFVVFYSSRRLGMESRVSVYGIAVGVWHHQRCIFLRLDSIRLLCNQFHTATSCGFHARLCRDWVHSSSNPSVKKVKCLFYRFYRSFT